MAFNSADTRQRAYNRIDTSNPGGSWIDEKFYNRSGTNKSKTLVGNWQEEERLEKDMTTVGHDQTVIRKTGKYFKGGFESTDYLLSDKEVHERTAECTTNQRNSFNDFNADVQKQKKPALGVRSSIRAQMVIAEAKDVFKAQEEAARQHDEALSTTYRDTMSKSGEGASRGVFQGKSEGARPYHADTPITLYTGNPNTGVSVVVPGKTEASGSGNPLAKNTNFTYNKFAL